MDHDQIWQAVWALLQNAAEAVAGEAEPEVSLTFAIERQRLTITVSDNGPGVPPETAPQIFRPFHTTKQDGSGIGLSLARQIARAHGGTLELVTLATEQDTSFRLVLPKSRTEAGS